MDDAPAPTEFARAAGISAPYASQILSGVRTPSQTLAINIFRRTGRKFGPIAHATDDEIDMLERLAKRAAEATPAEKAA